MYEVASGTQRPVRVCYYLQTHMRPAQIARLVRRIKEESPNSVVMINHDESVAPLDPFVFQGLSDVHVINGPGVYGDFSPIDRIFATLDWLDAHGIEFDWLQNLSGQDYPIRPLADLEQILGEGTHDGYLQYAPVFPEQTPAQADWGAGPDYRLCCPFDTSMRFLYTHRRIGRPTPAKQRWLRPVMAINLLQPWFRVSLAFSTVGFRRRTSIFNDDFVCYGGSFFGVLSAAALRYARNFALENPDVVRYFRTMAGPDELFLHTVLVNSGKFRLRPQSTHYIDWSRSRNNHPKVLGMADLPAMLASGAFWARKFDFGSPALDALDHEVRNLSRHSPLLAETSASRSRE